MSAGLATISRHGRLTPSELASRERIQRPTATRLIARLEEQGLVERMADPDDGRSISIATTPAGEARLERSRTRRDAFLTRRLERLGHEDRATLARATEILERLFADERT
jgi:DNA-binding MarR family transcriptional regulator